MRLREAIFNVIAPYDCLLCSTEGTLVCSWCWPELFELMPQQCFSCLADSPGAAVCAKCRPGIPLDHVWVVCPYRGGARQLVRRMKIDCQRQACWLIARAMHETAPVLSPGAVVTSVPTAPARIRERGIDHGGLIARKFARLRGLPYQQLLIRQGRAKQAGASRAVRAQQIKGAYQPKPGINMGSTHILLIDDVTTTGATLTEVAKVLHQAGAQTVDALVFAQTVEKPTL